MYAAQAVAMDAAQAALGALRLPSFRPGQAEAIVAAAEGRHIHFMAPTGYGKSAVAWGPACTARGVTVVVTPLLSLARDQVAALGALNIPAVCLAGEERDAAALRDLASDAPQLRLVFVCAEALEAGLPHWALQLRARRLLARVVVDEVHVVHDYGAEFRPAYQGLPAVLRAARLPVTLMSATVSCALEDELAEAFGTTEALRVRIFGEGHARFLVRPMPDDYPPAIAAEAAAAVSAGSAGQGVVFVNSRRRSGELSAALEALGMDVAPYHAGQESAQRRETEGLWRDGVLAWVCATTAFGLGIDNPRCAAVVFADPPLSAEALMQGMGRCGRGAEPGVCITFADDGAVGRGRFQLQVDRDPSAEVEARVARLEGVAQVLSDEGGCRHARLRAALGDSGAPAVCSNGCDMCSQQQL
jgi:RecQ family ATP-dependent DNA helicase